MDEAVNVIAQSGSPVLGAIVIVLGYAYWKQAQALSAVQEARVADAQKVATTLLEMQDRWQTSLNDLTQAVERLSAALPTKR
jgi:putative AlgH/UPF0301 family transcriptional regulator